LVFGGLFLGFVLVGFTAMFGFAGGSPEIRDGRYVLFNHGEITVIDKGTYEQALRDEQRFALGMLGAFGAGGAALCAAERTRGDW
jgi:hypothetical protein